MKDEEFGIQNEYDLFALSALYGKLLLSPILPLGPSRNLLFLCGKKKLFTTEDTAETEKKGKRIYASFTSPREKLCRNVNLLCSMAET